MRKVIELFDASHIQGHNPRVGLMMELRIAKDMIRVTMGVRHD